VGATASSSSPPKAAANGYSQRERMVWKEWRKRRVEREKGSVRTFVAVFSMVKGKTKGRRATL